MFSLPQLEDGSFKMQMTGWDIRSPAKVELPVNKCKWLASYPVTFWQERVRKKVDWKEGGKEIGIFAAHHAGRDVDKGWAIYLQ